ncbi:hypothetical protein GMRT_14246 [Giardia muris]|uniref:Uncharacterized protein n=1 Tax=Giardia muris TaxID=5742 RepID=A0A4Z1T7Y8_GIAMU|nr:hypothetical protein GMRT_14246 [Giardia muris]|eukprot:TNJ30213.1 hypothetical protein GMRT_14246 [Giardia muris]
MLLLQLEDLKAGCGDWKNIQPIVRTAFLGLYDLLQAQAATITQLSSQLTLLRQQQQRQLDELVRERCENFEASLRDFRGDLSTMRTELIEMINTKNETQMAHTQRLLSAKIDADEAVQLVSKAVTKDALDLMTRRLDTELEDLRRTADNIGEMIRRDMSTQLGGMATIEYVDTALVSIRATQVRPNDVQGMVQTLLDEHGYVTEHSEVFHQATRQTQDTTRELKRTLETSLSTLTDKQEALETRITSHADKLSQLTRLVSSQGDDISRATTELDTRMSERFVTVNRSIDDIMGRLQAVQDEAAMKPRRFQELARESVSEEVEKTVHKLVKYEIQDHDVRMREIIAEQIGANQDRIAKTVARAIIKENVRTQTDTDAKFGELAQLLTDSRQWYQGQIRQAVDGLAEHIQAEQQRLQQRLSLVDNLVHSSDAILSVPTARWLWKGKKLSSSGNIIWHSELCNTLQSNYIWDTGKSAILICLPGCYRIEFVIFSRRRPTIQLHINGEPLICAMSGDVAPYMYLKPKGDAMNTYVGQSLMDFLYLGENSRLQLVVVNDHDKACISGYLSLQKII